MEKIMTPKKRINSIDALRGFALFGILMFHCMEHFDLIIPGPELASPLWQKIDVIVFEAITFLFAGKAYAIFSLLFGLSFFMQMDSQADKGVDFRLRFLWRLIILLGLGYLNGIMYMGEFFVVYAILGVVLIPLYKVGTKWLIALAALLLLQIPDIVSFVSLLSGNAPNEPTSIVAYMDELYEQCADVFIHGSFTDVLQFNMWKGQFAKLLWVFNNARYPQLIALFISGMLIGRYGIHKSEEKIVKYSNLVLPYSIAVFAFFYAIVLLLPVFGVEGFALRAGTTLFKSYANLGMMTMYVSGFMLLYYKTGLRKAMDYMAPVGRMSVTNYMSQGMIGVPLFYGFGANLALELSFFQCMLVGFTIYTVQLIFSNLWMKRYYYGPVEWLWRTLTWFKKIPLRRNK
jgi:Predicted membrane protein